MTRNNLFPFTFLSYFRFSAANRNSKALPVRSQRLRKCLQSGKIRLLDLSPRVWLLSLPIESAPEPRCHVPLVSNNGNATSGGNSSEMVCDSKTCESLRKSVSTSYSSGHLLKVNTWRQTVHPSLMGHRDKISVYALSCPSMDQKGPGKDYAYCACYMLAAVSKSSTRTKLMKPPKKNHHGQM